MTNSSRRDAITIWNAAVTAVDSQRLVHNCLSIDGNILQICDQQISLNGVKHIEVVGTGKAGAGMARGIEQAFVTLPRTITWSGWLNVPADCVSTLEQITLHGARPAGINEPTQAGVDGTQEILSRVSSLNPNNLCIVLISGGGSALLPAPVSGVNLAEKLAVTRFLAAAGASIQELNTVRSGISSVKSGGLARACSAGRLLSLIISDVIGDPLDIIASGPTCHPIESSQPLKVLRRFDPDLSHTPPSVVEALQQQAELPEPTCHVENHIIGSNQIAIEAAASRAKALGYDVESWGSENAGAASDLGNRLFARLQALKPIASKTGKPICLLAGGESTVELSDESIRGKGGRNQELVLSAIAPNPSPELWQKVTLLSGGTDGEDGPTSAAGAVADEVLVTEMLAAGIDTDKHFQTNNAWPFFRQLDGLLNTGPTHTNVMDVQVGLVHP
jgi:glycerate 2-kinase